MNGRIGRPYRFPILRDTAEWERQEKRRERLMIAALIALLIIGFAIGGCNDAHGRC